MIYPNHLNCIKKILKIIRNIGNNDYLCGRNHPERPMKQQLTTKEEALMNIFWEKGDLCIRDLVESLPEPRPNYKTVATQVGFLESKGFLRRRPVANTFIYEVAITERQYRGSTVGEVVSRYYGNSYASLVSQFVEEKKLDVDELKALIEQIENQK